MILESLKDSDSFTYKVMNYDDFDQMITVQNLKFAIKAQTAIVWAFYSLKFNYTRLRFYEFGTH